MKQTLAWKHNEMRLLNGSRTSGTQEKDVSINKTQYLKDLALSLLREVQSLGDPRPLDVRQGIDFYDEVRRFEIDLIRRALIHTGGHQVRAAGLLGLKVTTLNSKIKQYSINVDDLMNDRAAPDSAETPPAP